MPGAAEAAVWAHHIGHGALALDRLPGHRMAMLCCTPPACRAATVVRRSEVPDTFMAFSLPESLAGLPEAVAATAWKFAER